MQDVSSAGGGLKQADLATNARVRQIKDLFGGPRGGGFVALLDQVRPGELITSEFMRGLLEGLARLEVDINDAGRVEVPDLFGKSLSEVVAQLGRNKLRPGRVLDAFGGDVDLAAGAKRFDDRKVLSQSPPAGSRVSADEPVNLLVSVQLLGLAGRLFEEFKHQGLYEMAGVIMREYAANIIKRNSNQRAPQPPQPQTGGTGKLADEMATPAEENKATPAEGSKPTASKSRRAARKTRGGATGGGKSV